MHFPVWQYLNQPLWDETRPTTLNPFEYWQRYKIWHLKRCLDNTFLEQCWDENYQDFITQHHDLCDRNTLEENPVWLLERCWSLNRCSLFSFHPEEDYPEIDTWENHF